VAATADFLDEVGQIVRELGDLGFDPVLVGGMALVVLGSRRVTRDFDFVIAQPGARLERLIDVFYDRGLELVARVDETGDVTSTISNRKVASARLRIDAPVSAYFLNRRTGLRIDLLFDYPVPAAKLAGAATRTKIRSHVFQVASEQDLLALKRIARKQRSVTGDAEDIAFLESRLKGPAAR
jgi:Nucleotidyl transferase AbiEii toxin, Type IV TA system